MISRLRVNHFTVFEGQDFAFSPHLNVIVGENGTGKSHLLKLVYALATSSNEHGRSSRGGKEEFQRILADSLRDLFQPDTLGRLVTRQQGRSRAEVEVEFSVAGAGFSCSFSSQNKTDVKLEALPEVYPADSVLFFPTREMLSIFPGFAAAYRARELNFDRTYYDLALALEAAPLRLPRVQEQNIIRQLEDLLGGVVLVENGRFYLKMPGAGNFEIPLVAEGLRKMAMLLYLLVNGQLRQNSVLLWDEPETNLNPRLLRTLAGVLLALARDGIQVFVATHSLFLLRELYLQQLEGSTKKLHLKFFNLWREQGKLQVDEGTSLDELSHIAALEEDLAQSERFFQAPAASL